MSRPLKLEYLDALYHITSRGDRRENIYGGIDRELLTRLKSIAAKSTTISKYRRCKKAPNQKHWIIIIQEKTVAMRLSLQPKRAVATHTSE